MTIIPIKVQLVWLLGALACNCVAGQSSTKPSEYIIIEAESFTEARTDSDDFARISKAAPASGNSILLRIFNPGTLHYKFDVPEDGTYSGWIRYTRRVARDIECEINGRQFIASSPATVDEGSNRDSWGWMSLFKAKLSAGNNEMVIFPSAWKIDCIVLSGDPSFQPTDEEILAYKPRALAPGQRELMHRQILPLVPEFLDDMPQYRLPEWFDGHRVQLHTRLTPSWYRKDKDFFLHPGSLLRGMGATVFSRHIVSGNEGAWWNSSVGAIHEMAMQMNAAKEIIDDAHRHGLRLIAYNRHIEDEWAADTHPEWRCVDPDGNPIMGTRGINMCMNSPYADYVLTRQMELVDLGVDGFFYDSVHMPRSGCWCQYCREKFTTLTGLIHPQRMDPDDPLWHRLKEFNNYTIARVFARWRKVLHERRPDIVMVVGSNLWPCLSDKHMDHRVFQIVDCHKTEFNKGTVYRSPSALWPFPADFKPMEEDVRLGFGFDVARDATDGRPAHVWAHRIQYESHMLGATAGMVAHGCIANIDVMENRIPDTNFISSFAMGERVSPYLAGTRPIRHVAILHSEQARDREGLDYQKVWKEYLYPMHAAYHVLLRDHIPCGFIFDSQLAQRKFDGISAIFVPNAAGLSEELVYALDDFKNRGGVIIENNPEWEWHTDAGWTDAANAFREQLESVPSPVQAFGDQEKMHMQAFASGDGKQTTICLTNDFSWVQVGGKGEEGYVEGDTEESLRDKPPACTGVVLKLAKQPNRIFEANSGTELKWSENGVKIPAFEYLAVVVAEY